MGKRLTQPPLHRHGHLTICIPKRMIGFYLPLITFTRLDCWQPPLPSLRDSLRLAFSARLASVCRRRSLPHLISPSRVEHISKSVSIVHKRRFQGRRKKIACLLQACAALYSLVTGLSKLRVHPLSTRLARPLFHGGVRRSMFDVRRSFPSFPSSQVSANTGTHCISYDLFEHTNAPHSRKIASPEKLRFATQSREHA